MRTFNLFVVHCSATREDCTLSPEALDVMHRRRGFNGTGYHYYIRKDGTLYLTRSLERIGAHAKGFNAHSPRGQKMPNMSTVAKEVSYFSACSEQKRAQNQFI